MSLWNIQKVLYSTLSNDTALNSLVTGVYDYVPDNTDYPYISLHLLEIDDWSSHDQDGFEITFEIIAFSKSNGSKECWEIFDLLYGLLHTADFFPEGNYTVHKSRFNRSIVRKRESSNLYELVADFNLTVTKT